jgi:hypothetical protein
VAEPIIIVKEDAGRRRGSKKAGYRKKASGEATLVKFQIVVLDSDGNEALSAALPNVSFDPSKRPKARRVHHPKYGRISKFTWE